MPCPTGKKWYRTHYKAICKAAKKRRGQKRRFSTKRSATIKQLWKTKAYRNKVEKTRRKTWKDPKHKAKMRRAIHDNVEVQRRKGASNAARWQDPEFHAVMCKKRKAQSKKYKKSYSDAMRKKWKDPVYHARMCKIRKTQSKGNQARHPEGSFYRTKYRGSKGKFWMRSGWEVAFAKWLDKHGIAWEYETKRFCLSKGHNYHPDFYLPDQNEYIEIKGWLTKADEKKLAKFAKLYPDEVLHVLREDHLLAIVAWAKRKGYIRRRKRKRK